MKQFHGTFRGWIAQWIPGNKLLLLGLFMLFYLVLMFGPSSIVPAELRNADSKAPAITVSDSLGDTHAVNLLEYQHTEESR